ncbi:hypothetical protein [Streptomyces sp. Iso 434]|uniref:hypothetical protein n=1 Tax=Streptomyces sp. Iso 434 TaxID=3062272 RepID=UPI0039800610
MDIPETLLDLERAAEAAREALATATDGERDARRADCLAASEAVNLAVTEHAQAITANRAKVREALKRQALHPEQPE